MASDGTIKFSYTSDKNGFVFYKISSSAVSSISPSNAIKQAITSGSDSFIIDPYLFIDEINATGKEPKMYFVTADGYGNQSAVRSIELGSSSTVTGYPVLSNCSFVMTAPNKGTFSCTSDKDGTTFLYRRHFFARKRFPTGLLYPLKPEATLSHRRQQTVIEREPRFITIPSNYGTIHRFSRFWVGTFIRCFNVQYAVGQYYAVTSA